MKKTPASAARQIAAELGRTDPKGTARLAVALANEYRHVAERNVHLEHCRNRVAGWCVRDVLDFLHERCATVEDYRMSASVCEMNAVDARNRERAAKFMAGLPEIVTFGPAERTLSRAEESYIARAAAFFNAGGNDWQGGDGWGFWFANGTMSFGASSWCCKNAHAQTIAKCRGDGINALRRLYIAGKNRELGAECVIV